MPFTSVKYFSLGYLPRRPSSCTHSLTSLIDFYMGFMFTATLSFLLRTVGLLTLICLTVSSSVLFIDAQSQQDTLISASKGIGFSSGFSFRVFSDTAVRPFSPTRIWSSSTPMLRLQVLNHLPFV